MGSLWNQSKLGLFNKAEDYAKAGKIDRLDRGQDR